MIRESKNIQGVFIVSLKRFEDERGHFLETFRKEWFPQRKWDNVQMNCSQSAPGVLRGLHYHRKQVDYWYVPQGIIRVGLADLRPDSPTFLNCQMLELGLTQKTGLYIPPGVGHGFVAMTDATLIYIVDNYYDAADDLGIIWNDPTLALDWRVKNPTLSARDKALPHLALSIPAAL